MTHNSGTWSKGHTPWNKGIKIDKKKYPKFGHLVNHSANTKQVMSDSANSYYEEFGTRKSPMKGKSHREDSKILTSSKLKGRISPMLGKTPWNKNKKLTETHIRNLVLSHLGNKQSENTKRKQKETWNKLEYKKIARDRRAKQIVPRFDTSIEIKIQQFLESLKIDYFKHKYLNIEHSYQCDLFIPSLNLVIECDGNYWHKYPTRTEIDNIRTEELIKEGFKVLRLWEHEIKIMSLNKFQEILNAQ